MMKPGFWIGSCCGIGAIPFAPGTWGSFAAALAAAAFLSAGILLDLLWLAVLLLVVGTILLFILGVGASNRYIAATEDKDPGVIVIDEWVGQWLTILIYMGGVALTDSVHGSFTHTAFTQNYGLEPLLVGGALLAGLFFFFRLFDIWKPGLIGRADAEVKGGMGVMLDDVIAGVFAGFAALGVTWITALFV